MAAYAKKNLNHYALVFKRTGEPQNIVHAEKPPITPVEIPSRPSAFAKELQTVPAGPAPEVVIPDYDREIVKTSLDGGFVL